jgi:hypothetical protein
VGDEMELMDRALGVVREQGDEDLALVTVSGLMGSGTSASTLAAAILLVGDPRLGGDAPSAATIDWRQCTRRAWVASESLTWHGGVRIM